jgi:lysophospholipase L1-like esterase
MKIILVLSILLLSSLAYYGLTFYQKFSVAQKLISKAVPYELESTTPGQTILVLGDSTAVGVGSDNATDTVPARLASHLNVARVENRAVSGARTRDLADQIVASRAEEYDLVLIMIGANDIIRFADVDLVVKDLEKALGSLPRHGKLAVVLSAGNLGGAQLFPWFVRPFHTRLNLKYHQEFVKVVGESGGDYVNLYEDPKTDPFTQNPGVYLAADGLHPSSAGYQIWFAKILEQTDLQRNSSE